MTLELRVTHESLFLAFEMGRVMTRVIKSDDLSIHYRVSALCIFAVCSVFWFENQLYFSTILLTSSVAELNFGGFDNWNTNLPKVNASGFVDQFVNFRISGKLFPSFRRETLKHCQKVIKAWPWIVGELAKFGPWLPISRLKWQRFWAWSTDFSPTKPEPSDQPQIDSKWWRSNRSIGGNADVLVHQRASPFR